MGNLSLGDIFGTFVIPFILMGGSLAVYLWFRRQSRLIDEEREREAKSNGSRPRPAE